jgi:hypothetical protein
MSLAPCGLWNYTSSPALVVLLFARFHPEMAAPFSAAVTLPAFWRGWTPAVQPTVGWPYVITVYRSVL